MRYMTNYDEFDINQFYLFCLNNPYKPENKHRYPFCVLERSKELEKMIIQCWINNHIPIGEMDKDFEKKVGALNKYHRT